MSQPVNNSGAMDIELTVDDVKTLDPAQIVMIHEQLRQSREDMKEALEQARDATEQARQEVRRMQSGWQACQKRVQRLESVLARVVVNMIDRGVLEDLLGEDL